MIKHPPFKVPVSQTTEDKVGLTELRAVLRGCGTIHTLPTEPYNVKTEVIIPNSNIVLMKKISYPFTVLM